MTHTITLIKFCTKCGKKKPLTAFSKHPMGKNGLDPRCKECKNNASKKYRQTHKIEIAEYNKKYHQTKQGKQTHAKAAKKYRQTIIGRLHRCFHQIKYRCINPKCTKYKYYGGRGIKVKFKNITEFIDYVINELQVDPRNLDIDRINNDGHYEKDNIRFVTHQENCNNKG